jgi:hypothetical protein
MKRYKFFKGQNYPLHAIYHQRVNLYNKKASGINGGDLLSFSYYLYTLLDLVVFFERHQS